MKDLTVRGALYVQGGRIGAKMFSGARPLGPRSGRSLLAYSSQTGRLFALTQPRAGEVKRLVRLTRPRDSGSVLSIWSEDKGWMTRGEALSGLGQPLSIAITEKDELLILDRAEQNGPLRLLRVDPESGRSVNLGTLGDARLRGNASITVGRDGRLLVATASETDTVLRHFAIDGGKLVAVDHSDAQGSLVGDVIENGGAVKFTVFVDNEPQTRSISLNAFRGEN